MNNALFIVFAVLAVAICFSNSLPNDFILDDYQIVAINPAIRSVSPVHLLSVPYWAQSRADGVGRGMKKGFSGIEAIPDGIPTDRKSVV